jgi:putative transposase
VSRLDPFRFLLISIAGWMNQRQQDAIEYLREENRVLRQQLGGRRLRFTDNQRRRLAAKRKALAAALWPKSQQSSPLRLFWLGIGS